MNPGVGLMLSAALAANLAACHDLTDSPKADPKATVISCLNQVLGTAFDPLLDGNEAGIDVRHCVEAEGFDCVKTQDSQVHCTRDRHTIDLTGMLKTYITQLN